MLCRLLPDLLSALQSETAAEEQSVVLMWDFLAAEIKG